VTGIRKKMPEKSAGKGPFKRASMGGSSNSSTRPSGKRREENSAEAASTTEGTAKGKEIGGAIEELIDS